MIVIMVVTSLGDNLSVVIIVERTFPNDWMSFGLWYSFSRYAPDATVLLKFKGGLSSQDLFHWPSKFKVRVARGEVAGKVLTVPPSLVLVRELGEEALAYLNGSNSPELHPNLCSEAKEGRYTPLISYEKGCGGFNGSDWINRNDCPYDMAESLMTHHATLSEVKVLQTWAQLGSIYSTISRG